MRLFVALTWVQERRKQVSIAARHAGRCHRRIQQHGKWKWWLRQVNLNPCWSHFLGTFFCVHFIHVFSCGVLLNFLSFSWFHRLLDMFCAQKKNDHCSQSQFCWRCPSIWFTFLKRTENTCHVFWSVGYDCGEILPNVTNGMIVNPKATTHPSVTKIICRPGYQVVGAGSVMCQTNSLWSPPGQCGGMFYCFA